MILETKPEIKEIMVNEKVVKLREKLSNIDCLK